MALKPRPKMPPLVIVRFHRQLQQIGVETQLVSVDLVPVTAVEPAAFGAGVD